MSTDPFQETLFAREAPFETQDNGVHEYREEPGLIVLRVHGSAIWCGMKADRGAFKVVATGDDPAEVLGATRRRVDEDETW